MKLISYTCLILILISCQKKTLNKSLIVDISKQEKKLPLLRALAESSEETCLEDLYTVENLRKEIAFYEAQFPATHEFQGQWNHLNYADVNFPTANFLRLYADTLGDQKVSDPNLFKDCKDVPCLYNRIYENEQSPNGYVHYLWFLKFGYVLSADNKIEKETEALRPGFWSDSEKDFKSYLFSDQEIYAFWRLSYLLKDSHQKIKSLKEIQRIPRTAVMSQGVCGRAWSSGFVNVSDNCLELSSDKNSGYFYHAVSHELTHMIDYEQGREARGRYRSHFNDFLALSGFTKVEYEENGAMKTRWDFNHSVKYISEYSTKSPQEYFAESLSAFRVKPEKFKELNYVELEDFIKTSYYQGQSYDSEGSFEQWLKRFSDKKVLSDRIKNCLNSDSKGETQIFKSIDFVTSFNEGQLACLSDVFDVTQKEISSLIKLKEIDGCSILKTKPSEWRDYIQRWFPREVEKIAIEKPVTEKVEEKVSEVKLINLEDPELAMRAMLKCVNADEKMICYQDELKNIIEEVSKSWGLDDSQMVEYRDRYLAFHLFEEIAPKIDHSVDKVIQTTYPEIIDHALTSWDLCYQEKDSQAVYLEGMLNLNGGFMKSGMMNCLNREIPDAAKKIMRGLTNSKSVGADDEVVLMKGFSDQMVKEISSFYETKLKDELAQSEIWMKNNQDNLISFVKKKFKKVTQKNKTQCQREVLKKISFEANFHTTSDLFYPVVRDKICR